MSAALHVDGRLTDLLARLDPALGTALERGAALARRFHATELGPEHLLASLLEDEECAATRLVLFAFSDPETIAVEALALAPGVMVVSAERCLPFSVLGRRALEEAHREAVERAHGAVETAHLVVAALPHLSAEARADLERAGLDAGAALERMPAAAEPLLPDGPLLRPLTPDARRAVSAAGRLAARLGRRSVAPAHLLLACLETDAELAEAAGLTASRGRHALTDRDADDSPVEGDPLPVTEELFRLLEGLEPGGDTGSFLAELVLRGSEELRALLLRQKVSPALVERAGASFRD